MPSYILSEPYKQRVDRALSVVEGQPSQGGVTTIPTRFETLPQPAPRPFRYFRLLSQMTPCKTATAVEVRPVCCGQSDLRMDLVDFPVAKPPVVLYDHLGSARTFNLGEGKSRNQVIPSGTYALARWVSFTNDDTDLECGAQGVWELVGFLPCAAAACGDDPSSSSEQSSSSPESSSSDYSSSSSSSDSSSSGSGDSSSSSGDGSSGSGDGSSASVDGSSGSSWRSSGSGGSDCTQCGGNQIEVVTNVSCAGGNLTVTKETIEAPKCC